MCVYMCARANIRFWNIFNEKIIYLTFVKFTKLQRNIILKSDLPFVDFYQGLYVDCIWSPTVNETYKCQWVYPFLYLGSCSSFVTVHEHLCESFCHVPATLMRQPIRWAEFSAPGFFRPLWSASPPPGTTIEFSSLEPLNNVCLWKF